MSGEGRQVLDIIMGRYTANGGTGDSVYLAGVSGDTVFRDRKGSDGNPEEAVIHHPCLTVAVFVQPGRYLEFAAPTLRDSGVLARVWPVWLPSMVGFRLEEEDEQGLQRDLMQPYYEQVESILRKEPRRDESGRAIPHTARLCAEAIEARRVFHNTVESGMAEGGDLEDVRDIASNATTQVTKQALVLHVMADPDVLGSPSSLISRDTWRAAETLGTFYLGETIRSQRMAVEDASLEPSRRVLRWIQDERLTELTARDLSRAGPRPRMNAEDAHRALDLLTDHGYLAEYRPEGKRKPVYRVNPALLRHGWCGMSMQAASYGRLGKDPVASQTSSGKDMTTTMAMVVPYERPIVAWLTYPMRPSNRAPAPLP
jgi:hypothetical protein